MVSSFCLELLVYAVFSYWCAIPPTPASPPSQRDHPSHTQDLPRLLKAQTLDIHPLSCQCLYFCASMQVRLWY
jgi:hypothetical protein